MTWNKVDHKFTYPELNYESSGNWQPTLKVSVYFRKKGDISYDTFFGHWRTVHADLALATREFQDGIIRYVQHHQTPEMKDRAKSLGEGVLDYDGCAQLWVRDWDAWLAFYNSKEYTAALGPDCQRFMELPMTYMVGYENVVIGEGIVGGKAGLNLQSK